MFGVSLGNSDDTWKTIWNKEAVNCSFETGFGHLSLNLIQEWKGRIVLTARTLFAIKKENFYEMEKSGNKENESIVTFEFMLPRGYELTGDLGVGFDGSGQRSFFSVGSSVEIPLSELVVTARELELFISRGKPVPEQKLQVEEKTLTGTERNTLLVIIAALLQELKINPANKGTAAYLEKLTIDIGEKVTEETILGKLRQIPDSLGKRKK